VKGRLLRTTQALLQPNRIRVDDGIQFTPIILQTNGVLQGDSYSPTLFVCYLTSLCNRLETEIPQAKSLFYADDMAAFSREPSGIKAILETLCSWSSEFKLQVNAQKTKIMVFRRGGRLPGGLRFEYNDKPLEIVAKYEYLGITLQPTLTFTEHIAKLRGKCAAAISTIPNLQSCSIETAQRIFAMKVQPIVTHNMQTFARRLSAPQLRQLDGPKAMFYKRALSLHSNTSNTFVIMMVRMKTLVDDISDRYAFNPIALAQYHSTCETRVNELMEIMQPPGPAFTSAAWMGSCQKQRHVITRCTVHGFHNHVCTTRNCYNASDSCVCRICGMSAIHRMHVLDCSRGGLALSEFVAACSDT